MAAYLLNSTALGLVERPDFRGALVTFSASGNMLYSRVVDVLLIHVKCKEWQG